MRLHACLPVFEQCSLHTADMSTNMAMFSQAGLLGIRPKGFAGPPERFEADDFYRCVSWQMPLAHACT